MKKAKVILIWIIGLMFIATGISKFLHLDTMSESLFNKMNYPSWLFYMAAAFELLGGFLMLIRSTRQLGTFMITVIMLGAIWTHFYLYDDYKHLIAPIVIILLSSFLAVNSQKK